MDKYSDLDSKQLKKIYINLIYKLLPLREEGKDWRGFLVSLIQEIDGAANITDKLDNAIMFRLISKLNGLLFLTSEEDFNDYRKIIFQCIKLLGSGGVKDD